MPTIEGLRLKLLKYPTKGLVNYRSKKIRKKDFTII